MENKILDDFEKVSISALAADPANARKHDKRNIEEIARSLREFGQHAPIVAQRSTRRVLVGNGRLEGMKALGWTEALVLWVDDDNVTAVRRALADNRVAELAEWDDAILQEILVGLGDEANVPGWNDAELDVILSLGDDGTVKEDDPDLDPPEVPVSKSGQVWALGRHRLIVGDATSLADMQALMGGKRADLVVTDPPYNVDYTGKTKDALKIKNDKKSDGAFRAFLVDSFKAMFEVTRPGAPIYVFHADSEGFNFRGAMVEAGFLLKQCLIWAKNTMVLGRQDYQWKHEPILYGWKPGGAHSWYGGRKKTTLLEDESAVVIRKNGDSSLVTFVQGTQSVTLKVPAFEVLDGGDDSGTSLWRYEKPSRNAEHPTMKPLGLIARALRNSSREGDHVLDPFGGSGSTLIAAEQTGRTCFMAELDPGYADVIIRRWEALTGEIATLV